MAGVPWDLLAWAYQNSGPGLTLLTLVGFALVYLKDVRPALTRHGDRLDDQDERLQSGAISMAERDVLLENAHERVDSLDGDLERAEDAREKLGRRLRALEQGFAEEHGHTPTLRGGGGDAQGAGD